MAKVARWEFVGKWWLFWLFSISIVGIPVAILYLVNATLRIEEEVADPEALLERLR